MGSRFGRPSGAYTSTSNTSNNTKYQTDAAATAPRVPASDVKVDGDFNFIIDSLNALDDDVASVVAGGLPTPSGTNVVLASVDGSTYTTTKVTDAMLQSGNLAVTDSTNTFTDQQTVDMPGKGVIDVGGDATSSIAGEINLFGHDDGGNNTTYASLQGEILDDTDTSEDGKLNFLTQVGGSLATRGYVGQGLVIGSPTGADKGAGKINATEIYENNDRVAALGKVNAFTGNNTFAGTSTFNSTVDINSGTIDGVTIGTNSAITELQVDNINVNGNTISSTNTNGDIVISPNGTGRIDASSSIIENVTDPTSAQDAATKAYVDSAVVNTAPSVVTFTSGGTFTKASYPGLVGVKVTVIGGGGGFSPGNAGTPTNGGTTSFGAFLSATGGQTRHSGQTNPTPGSGSGGDVNLSGGKSIGLHSGTNGDVAIGGCAPFGLTSQQNIAGDLDDTGDSSAGLLYGGGATPGFDGISAPATLYGGAAGGGAQEYIPASSLSTSETVTIGAAGTPGTASPGNDKNGAAGICIVELFY